MLENNKIIQNIKQSLLIEGLNIDNNDINIINSFLNGEITENQAVERIRNEFKSLR